MQVLHILSNRKWTERAEPVTDLVAAQRRAGVATDLACGVCTRPHMRESSVEVQATHKGVPPIVLQLPKHFRPLAMWQDVATLRGLIRGRSLDVLHAHMGNAHLAAVLAAGRGAHRPLIVSSSYETDGPPPGLRSHWLHGRRTDGLIVISDTARAAARQRFGLPAARVEVIEPGIDLARFQAGNDAPNLRAELGLATSSFIVGVVSRIRQDRRIDLAIRMLAALRDECPDLAVVIVGRGEASGELQALAGQLGLANRVYWAGYCRATRLVAAYRCADVLLYPVPGTDQSCRTVREALASGRPVIAGRTGFLPELIDEGRTGHLVDLSAEAIATVVRDLYHARARTAEMGATAARTAVQRFSLDRQAEQTLAFYQRLSAQRDATGRREGAE